MSGSFKRVVVFNGNREWTIENDEEEMILFAKRCLERIARGQIAAMHDIHYLVNELHLPPAKFGRTEKQLEQNICYSALETLV